MWQFDVFWRVKQTGGGWCSLSQLRWLAAQCRARLLAVHVDASDESIDAISACELQRTSRRPILRGFDWTSSAFVLAASGGNACAAIRLTYDAGG